MRQKYSDAACLGRWQTREHVHDVRVRVEPIRLVGVISNDVVHTAAKPPTLSACSCGGCTFLSGKAPLF